MSDHDKSLNKRITVWVGCITAILTLVFGLQRLYTQLSTTVKAKKEVETLIQSSQIQLDAGGYSQAWKILSQADQHEVMQDEIDIAKIKTAMVWLQNMRANEMVGTFTEQTERILPVLSKAASTAEGEYLADIYAHMGWADYLRLRDGNFGLNPEIYYEKALAADANNAYANTMLGHWLSRHNKDVESGWQYFQVAVKSGQDLQYTRSMQFAALKNISYNNIDFLKLLHDMKLNGETIENDVADHVLRSNYLGNGFRRFIDALRTGNPVQTSIAPEDDLALFEWLWHEYPHLVTKYLSHQQPYIHAILTEATGDNAASVKMYTELYAGLPDNNPTIYEIDEYLQNAITRTSSNQSN